MRYGSGVRDVVIVAELNDTNTVYGTATTHSPVVYRKQATLVKDGVEVSMSWSDAIIRRCGSC